MIFPYQLGSDVRQLFENFPITPPNGVSFNWRIEEGVYLQKSGLVKVTPTIVLEGDEVPWLMEREERIVSRLKEQEILEGGSGTNHTKVRRVEYPVYDDLYMILGGRSAIQEGDSIFGIPVNIPDNSLLNLYLEKGVYRHGDGVLVLPERIMISDGTVQDKLFLSRSDYLMLSRLKEQEIISSHLRG